MCALREYMEPSVFFSEALHGIFFRGSPEHCADTLGVLSQRVSISDFAGEGGIIRDSIHWGPELETHHENKSESYLDQSAKFNSELLINDIQVARKTADLHLLQCPLKSVQQILSPKFKLL